MFEIPVENTWKTRVTNSKIKVMILLFFRGEFLVKNKYARYYRSKHFFELKKKTYLACCTSLIDKKAVKSSDFVNHSLIIARTNESIVPPWWLICYSWSLISWFFSPHIRESGIRQSFCLWNPEYLALESGIQFKESVLPLTKTGTNAWNPKSAAWNQQGKTVS